MENEMKSKKKAEKGDRVVIGIVIMLSDLKSSSGA